MTRGGAILASLLVTISRPTWWLLALVGFLLRGGFIAFLLPIILLPSPLALANLAAPVVVPVALGRIGPETIGLVLIAVSSLLAWLVAGGWLAASTDLALIRESHAEAIEEGVAAPWPGGPSPRETAAGPRRDRILIGRMLAARLIAWLPLAVALAIGVVKAVAVTYAELTRPFDVATPLPVRVVLGTSFELGIIVLAMLFGELSGGLAGRQIAVRGATVRSALGGAVADIARRPLSTIVPWLATTALLVVILAGTVGAAGIAWSRVLGALSDRNAQALATALDLLLFVAIWLAALVVAGVFTAIRSSAQTFEAVRRLHPTGTFGASAHHRPGDWTMPDEGGSL